jgi:hypothetical protein
VIHDTPRQGGFRPTDYAGRSVAGQGYRPMVYPEVRAYLLRW